MSMVTTSCDWGHATPDPYICPDEGTNGMRVRMGPEVPPIDYRFCDRHMRETIIKLMLNEAGIFPPE